MDPRNRASFWAARSSSALFSTWSEAVGGAYLTGLATRVFSQCLLLPGGIRTRVETEPLIFCKGSPTRVVSGPGKFWVRHQQVVSFFFFSPGGFFGIGAEYSDVRVVRARAQ